MSLSLSSVTAREVLHNVRERVKPWGEFLDTKKFALPSSLVPLPRRILSNVYEFQGNYLFVFLGLFVFCIMTSPLLLVAIGICLGACFYVSSRGPDQPLAIMGFPLSVSQQYLGVAVLSFPLFWLAGAGSAVFWIIGASCFVIMLHAATYTNEEEEEGFDLEMDSIKTLS
ncbi:prenylated Rab acceptor protein 1-like isoform X2 [Babylonia areolata]